MEYYLFRVISVSSQSLHAVTTQLKQWGEFVKDELISSFSSDLIRFYYGTDLVGNEIGAAAKNVIGIAAGMLDGLECSTLKGALMARGSKEVG